MVGLSVVWLTVRAAQMVCLEWLTDWQSVFSVTHRATQLVFIVTHSNSCKVGLSLLWLSVTYRVGHITKYEPSLTYVNWSTVGLPLLWLTVRGAQLVSLYCGSQQEVHSWSVFTVTHSKSCTVSQSLLWLIVGMARLLSQLKQHDLSQLSSLQLSIYIC